MVLQEPHSRENGSDSLDFRNTNTLWASVLVETLVRCGLRSAIACPGSRSTPLTIALARHPRVEALSILDERSAAFFALGLALQTGRAVALVCTSGTAGANMFPAVIEAYESRVPLLVLTADRPPELRQCNAGQAIEQIRLFGHYPNWQTELAVPQSEPSLLRYLRQTIVQAWHRCYAPSPGAVHLNCPFRDPLSPPPDDRATEAALSLTNGDFATFFDRIDRLPAASLSGQCAAVGHLDGQAVTTAITQWRSHDRGVIIAGVATSLAPDRYTADVLKLATYLGWPVLAEGLSPVRHHLPEPERSPVITTYDLVLRHPSPELAPTAVIQLGPLPTSKVLRAWLGDHDPERWIVDPGDRNLDPLHGRTHRLPCDLGEVVCCLSQCLGWASNVELGINPPAAADYLATWQQRDRHTRRVIAQHFQARETSGKPLLEPQIVWCLAQTLPSQTPIFIANSMPVRDVESVWPPSDRRLQPWFNRGANGIDGTLSTALGVAHRHRPGVLLTGDLALLHDTNGFLAARSLVGSLTIVLIDNHGGGIFELLPVAQFEPPFEEFFATPQSVDFPLLCRAYGVDYAAIESIAALRSAIVSLPSSGLRLLHLRTDRKHNAQWRTHNFNQFGQRRS